MRRTTSLLVAALTLPLSTACDAIRTGGDSGEALRDGVRVTGGSGSVTVQELIREYRPEMDDRLGLFGVSDLELVDGRLFLVEHGNHRITVTDTLFDLVDRFGRRGEGPGELASPWSLELLPSGRLAVLERGNARISLFTQRGEFVRAIPRATPHSEVGAFDDTTFVVSGPGGDFGAAIRYGPEGTGAPFGPRGLPERGLEDIILDQSARIRVRGGDVLTVVRSKEGVLETYDGQGSLQRVDTLPRDVLDRLRSRRDGLVGDLTDQGFVRVDVPMVKRVSATSAGRLLIPVSLPDPFALLYDPATGAFTRLNAPDTPRERAMLRATQVGLLHGESLYLVRDDGIAVFRVPRS